MLCDGLKTQCRQTSEIRRIPTQWWYPQYPQFSQNALCFLKPSTFYLATSVFKFQCAAETSSTELRFAEVRVFRVTWLEILKLFVLDAVHDLWCVKGIIMLVAFKSCDLRDWDSVRWGNMKVSVWECLIIQTFASWTDWSFEEKRHGWTFYTPF